MIIKKEFYKEIYFIDGAESLTNNQFNNLLLVSTKNWNHYFTPFKTKKEVEKIKDVVMLEFDTDSNMFKYLKAVNDELILDYSLEHENPTILKLN